MQLESLVFFLGSSADIPQMNTALATLATSFQDVPSIARAEIATIGLKQPMVTIPIPANRQGDIIARLEAEMNKVGISMAKPPG